MNDLDTIKRVNAQIEALYTPIIVCVDQAGETYCVAVTNGAERVGAGMWLRQLVDEGRVASA